MTSLLPLLHPTCCRFAGHWLADALRIADSPQDAVGSAMKADQKYPQLSQEIKYTNLFVPDLGAYVDDPKTECTIIAADNKVNQMVAGPMAGMGYSSDS